MENKQSKTPDNPLGPIPGDVFDRLVSKKYNLYNSLFLNLPFARIHNTGIMLPLLSHACRQGLAAAASPAGILRGFFSEQADLAGEAEQIDFMFRIIQYVERQVVLFDSIEEAAFTELVAHEEQLSLSEFLHLLRSNGNSRELLEKWKHFSARIVLTAHPTQFYTPQVLDIIARLRSFIIDNNVDAIDTTLQQLGLTSLLNRDKPTPLQEARNVIYFLRHVYYDAVGELHGRIKAQLNDPDFANPPKIELGFWPGGDRDGNPYVTSATTLAVADELRLNLLKCYYRDVKELQRLLTFKGIEEIISGLRQRLYTAMIDAQTSISSASITDDLLRIRQLLLQRYHGLFLAELDSLLDKVAIFGMHFATLDIRQHHDVHQQAIIAILRQNEMIREELAELNEDDLIATLCEAMWQPRPDDFSDALLRDTLLTMQQIPVIQSKNGQRGCQRYIISNAEDAFAVLFVYALLRWTWPSGGEMAVDIVPLFESMAAMDNAAAIMRRLFALPAYRQHVARCGDRQTIMLGFSDGTKDGGYLMANWSILRCKEELTSVCWEYGITAIFFDGRGGPPARGGGNTHRFYAAQTAAVANHAIQLTIQGQTISSKYGTHEHFIYNCEQLLTAGLANIADSKEQQLSTRARGLLQELADISRDKYEALKQHPEFIPYLEQKSTLKYYGQSNIGSRPVRRGGTDKLDLKDLRAIPFVSSWSQLRQNVPGYFGFGTALQTLVQRGEKQAVKWLYQQVPYFRALVHNSMMSLSKCNFALTRYLSDDPKFGPFWHILHDEYQLAKEMLLLLSGDEELMATEPIARGSIRKREEIVLPLLVIQQYALQQIETAPEKRELYEKIVRRALYGNVNASRNSA
jgi:phosphoenolpyruvate carboxylase